MSEEELNYQSVKKAANCAKRSQVTLPAKIQQIQERNQTTSPSQHLLTTTSRNINGMRSYW